jgi:hypothetical protein
MISPATLPAREFLGADVALLGQLDQLDQLVHRPRVTVVAAVHLHQFGNGQIALYTALL